MLSFVFLSHGVGFISFQLLASKTTEQKLSISICHRILTIQNVVSEPNTQKKTVPKKNRSQERAWKTEPETCIFLVFHFVWGHYAFENVSKMYQIKRATQVIAWPHLLLNTWRNCDLRKWNINCGYSVKLSGNRKLLGSSFWNTPNFWHILINILSIHRRTSGPSAWVSARQTAIRANRTADASWSNEADMWSKAKILKERPTF